MVINLSLYICVSTHLWIIHNLTNFSWNQVANQYSFSKHEVNTTMEVQKPGWGSWTFSPKVLEVDVKPELANVYTVIPLQPVFCLSVTPPFDSYHFPSVWVVIDWSERNDISQHLLSAQCVMDTVLRALICVNFILTITLWSRFCYHLYFADGKLKHREVCNLPKVKQLGSGGTLGSNPDRLALHH